MCNCWKEGKVAPPPFDPSLFSAEGGIPHLTVPVDGNEDLYLRHHEWMRNCCEHPFMRIGLKTFGAYFITDNGPMQHRLMCEALEQFGADELPNLRKLTRALGENFMGTLTLDDMKATLKEIAILRNSKTDPCLVNGQEQLDVIWDSHIYGRDITRMLWPAQGDHGKSLFRAELDRNGFNLFSQISAESDRWDKVFQAERFEQKTVTGTGQLSDLNFETTFINLDNGTSFVGNIGVDKGETSFTPFLCVEYSGGRNRYSFATKIEEICAAALDLGQAVHFSGPDVILLEWDVDEQIILDAEAEDMLWKEEVGARRAGEENERSR
jgi:hypothetical protein